jgi:hypothetical protein
MDIQKPIVSHSGPINAQKQPRPRDKDLPELDNPNVGNPDSEPGKDRPEQRPITDNKAGG